MKDKNTAIHYNGVSSAGVGSIIPATNIVDNNLYNGNYYIDNATNYPTDITIERNGKRVGLFEEIEKINKRLLILEPNFKKMEKYPALKEAYDNYKLIEAMLTSNDDE